MAHRADTERDLGRDQAVNKKTFDCVEMKRKGAARVQARLQGMSREEQLRYWQERTNELMELQREVLRTRKAS
jgi:hypothetical protein